MAEVRYMPWGETRYASGTTPTTFRYTGQREDVSTAGGELYFFRARTYDPVVGRFLSADSIVPEPGNPQALNRYALVVNNPLRYTDPTGHKYCDFATVDDCRPYANTVDHWARQYGITFKGLWSFQDKLNMLGGAEAVGTALAAATEARESADVFRSAMGNLKIELREATAGEDTSRYHCARTGSGFQCSAGATGRIGGRLLAHELGHVFNARIANHGGITPYTTLSGSTIRDDLGNHVTGINAAGQWERTFMGFPGDRAPDVFHGRDWDDWNRPGEDYADMFLHWAYNSFDYSANAYGAGANRYSWMAVNMAQWIDAASR